MATERVPHHEQRNGVIRHSVYRSRNIVKSPIQIVHLKAAQSSRFGEAYAAVVHRQSGVALLCSEECEVLETIAERQWHLRPPDARAEGLPLCNAGLATHNRHGL